MRVVLGQIQGFLERSVPESSGVVVGVSGGADSVALLHLLHRASQRLAKKRPLIVAHANHQLRASESDDDEQFVRQLAERLDCEFVSRRLAVREAVAHTPDSVEMVARRLRHLFLASTAQAKGWHHISLAHHADDQAELVLIRLLRGGGSDGLGGMAETSPSPVDSDIRLWRPLLKQDREQIRAWLAQENLPFREDSSNFDTAIVRNRVRAELLPQLARIYNPAIARVLCRTADILGAEADFIRDSALEWISHEHKRPFAELPLALQRAVLREQLLSLGQVPDFELVERLRLHPDSRQSAPRDEGYRLTASGGLSRQPINIPASPFPAIRLELSGVEGSVPIGGRELVWKISSQPQPLGTPGLEQFDMAKIGSTQILVRSWLPGDRFRPLGYPCAAKLHDIFISHKIPRDRRSEVLVFEALEKRIFWVEGLPLGEEFKIDATTGLILTLSVRRPRGP